MCNFEILLWFIRKKQHKIKEIWSFSVLLPTPVWQLPLPLTELIKSEPCTFVCTHKIMKTTGKSGLASGSCFECFVCIYFGKFGSNINLRQNKTKKDKNKLSSPEKSCVGPIWERSFALLDIQWRFPQPYSCSPTSLKSTGITYDTISCNNEATKETGI